MNEEMNNSYMQEDEIDIMEYVRKLLKNWKFVAKWCCIAAVVGVVAALSAVSTYTATSKMAPEVSGKSGGGSLSSLASLAGINLSSISTSDAISPDLYPEIVQSIPFLTELFTMPVESEYKNKPVQCNFYEYMLNCCKAPWYKYVINAPMSALGWVFGLLKPDEEKLPKGFKFLGEVDNAHLTKAQDKVIKAMKENISIAVDKKTTVISLSVTTQDPAISKQLADTIIENLKEYITAYRTEKARKDLEYYETLFYEAKADYEAAQQKYARYVDSNQGIVRQSVRTEQERLQNEMNLQYQLYNSCAQQVQVSKAQVQRETPVCAVLMPPSIPIKDNESGAKTLAIFIFLGFCLSALWVVWLKDKLAEFKNTSDTDSK